MGNVSKVVQVTKPTYKLRYSIEEWNKPAHGTPQKVMKGVSVTDDNYGYADNLFIASIVGEGENESILLLDSTTQSLPSKKMLEKIKDAIDHYLEHGYCIE